MGSSSYDDGPNLRIFFAGGGKEVGGFKTVLLSSSGLLVSSSDRKGMDDGKILGLDQAEPAGDAVPPEGAGDDIVVVVVVVVVVAVVAAVVLVLLTPALIFDVEIIFFLDDTALPLSGKSLRDWKFRGLRPRTITGPERTSQIGILSPVDSVAMTFNRTTKCCCNSLRRPLLAVATRNCNRFHEMGNVA